MMPLSPQILAMLQQSYNPVRAPMAVPGMNPMGGGAPSIQAMLANLAAQSRGGGGNPFGFAGGWGGGVGNRIDRRSPRVPNRPFSALGPFLGGMLGFGGGFFGGRRNVDPRSGRDMGGGTGNRSVAGGRSVGGLAVGNDGRIAGGI